MNTDTATMEFTLDELKAILEMMRMVRNEGMEDDMHAHLLNRFTDAAKDLEYEN